MLNRESSPIELRFDLTGKIDLAGEHSVAASLFVPSSEDWDTLGAAGLPSGREQFALGAALRANEDTLGAARLPSEREQFALGAALRANGDTLGAARLPSEREQFALGAALRANGDTLGAARLPSEREQFALGAALRANGRAQPIVLFCLHGGSYNKTYYDMQIPGRTGYSFARDMAARGFIVITVDDLGVGESSRPTDELSLTMEVVAAANAEIARACVEGLANGTLAPGISALGARPLLIGLGHSMGGMLTIFQQARWHSFDAIGVLGFSPFGWGSASLELNSPFRGAENLDGRELLARLRTQHVKAGFLGYKKIDASKMRHYHHWDDVPEDVMAAEDAAADCLPGIAGVTGQVPGLVSPEAAKITCPVFIHWAEREPFFFDPHRDASLFKKSWDVTVFVQPRSGHSHNLANTRRVFWDRLAGWITTVGSTAKAAASS